ncbi:MAG: dATP/dGTP pyrophosphohydrolase domain-containing protein [Mesorhizobium sp.]
MRYSQDYKIKDGTIFRLGDTVETIKGAKFWGEIIAFDTDEASPGCTVRAVDPGFEGTKHIYPLKQLRHRPEDGWKKPWTIERVILQPLVAANLLNAANDRVQDLLEANNRYQQEARDARAALKNIFDPVAHLSRQREWSKRTFGPGARTKGVLDHIRKELAEVEACPTDLSEWIDVIILACDGALRAGHEPGAIVEAWITKQARNEKRQWPDWRTADPEKAIEHVKEPANA